MFPGESSSHLLLAQHSLAPALLARFQNGLLYRFIRGRVCTPADLITEPVWMGVARRLGEWHAVLPIVSTYVSTSSADGLDNIEPSTQALTSASVEQINAITPNMSTPNIWTVMQKWIYALPVNNKKEKERQVTLQYELIRSVKELANVSGLGKDGVSLSLR